MSTKWQKVYGSAGAVDVEEEMADFRLKNNQCAFAEVIFC